MDLWANIRQYVSQKFLISLIIALIVTLVTVILGAWLGTHVSESEAKEIWNILDKQVREATWHDIFFHNLSLSVLTLIPFIGVGWMLFIMFNTGFFLGAISVVLLPGDPITRLILVLFVTFVFPGFVVAFFEFGAYILLMGEVFYVTYLALTRSGAKQRLRKHFWKTLLIYVVMLLIGALIEKALIS